jgi:hypothetical protein
LFDCRQWFGQRMTSSQVTPAIFDSPFRDSIIRFRRGIEQSCRSDDLRRAGYARMTRFDLDHLLDSLEDMLSARAAHPVLFCFAYPQHCRAWAFPCCHRQYKLPHEVTNI